MSVCGTERKLTDAGQAMGRLTWFGTNTDVTEQIEAENALRDLTETL